MVKPVSEKRIAIISSRIKTLDDSSIEAENWINKYVTLGYKVHLISGKFGEPVDLPYLEIPELDFKYSAIRGVKKIMFENELDKIGHKATRILLNSLVNRIYPKLKDYVIKNKIDILVIENVLGNLTNPAANIAITKLIKDTKLPTISRYFSFFWNKPYFKNNNNFAALKKSNPPQLKNIVHVVCSQSAKKELESRGIKAQIIPLTLDGDKLQIKDEYNEDFREHFGIKEDQLIFLHPTRINRQKGIERSIKIVKEINDITKKDNILMITGAPVYFSGNYFEEVMRKINKMNINTILVHDSIFTSRHQNKERKFYSINDAVLNSDMILFSTESEEDIGLPVLYGMAYKKPIFVKKDSIAKEILDKHPSFVFLEDKITAETISDIYEILQNKEKRTEVTEHNYKIFLENFTTEELDEKLVPLLNSLEKQPFFKSIKKLF